MGLELDADRILLRLTSPTSQFVDHAKGMALGSGDESCTRGALSISTLDKQPDVPQYVGTLRKPVILLIHMFSCFLMVSGLSQFLQSYEKKKGKLATSSTPWAHCDLL